MKKNKGIIFTGLVIGLISVLLVKFGNPANMGFCIACFIRDTAGALGLHRAEAVQYVRPEIIGIVIGGFLMSIAGKEFKVRGGSAPLTRFVLGFFVMIGALMFLGCPLRMILRLAGGDLNAIFGILGFAGGIFVGVLFLNKGFSLRRTYELPKLEGIIMPSVTVVLFILLVAFPSLLLFSEKGPGASHAPIYFSLVNGLIVGVLAQKNKLCCAGGIRDVIMFKDFHLISGFLAIFIAALVGNLLLGQFKLGFVDQPIAHTDGLWNFLGMGLVGFASVLLGGCPLRQLILSAEGNIDSAITVLGLVFGAAFAHNFNLASSAQGPTLNGKVAVVIGFIVVFLIGYFNIEKSTEVEIKEGVEIEI
ncbi:MAG TPA: YedE family putative selenium transporter [Soehngenia sp.]|nr:YedE family putative selenium transporter [Soehngenia sp.]